ncbi:MAG: glycine--tRNA ligase [Deltaproteobacteria bacterium]|nr:glycine--tRNA ligase [Deltaproteobacteria bacterium]
MAEIKSLTDMQDLVALAKRRGLVFQSSEIYGGINACWDYGPLGVEMKNNVKQLWWRAMVDRDDIEGIDAAILMHPRVWEASGHVAGFSDPLVDCKKCKQRFREDKIHDENRVAKKCPNCGGELTEPRMFNLMFKTFMGPVEEDAAVVYLRPETAQGIYVNFQNVAATSRQKIPFGIAQIGKAFRNEITPGNFIFRTREFEQMEMQFFVKPGTDEKWFEYWMEERRKWHLSNGLRANKIRFHEHGPGELAHYAKKAFDIEYEFPFGWQEFEGIHNRTDFDLGRHQEYSGKKQEYYDESDKSRYIPYIVETSAGCDRTLLTLLADAYRSEEDRVFLALHPKLAPYKAAVFPLMKKPELMEPAERIYKDLAKKFRVTLDETGSIGKRYYRQDEIGTPFCITIDFDTVEKNAGVTVRHRDTKEQERIEVSRVVQYLDDQFANW